jgi:hypothetical protein
MENGYLDDSEVAAFFRYALIRPLARMAQALACSR